MKIKKILAMVLCTAMAISLFSGCEGAKQNDVGTMTKEEIETFEAKAGGLKLPLDNKRTEITVLTESSHNNLSESTVIKELSRRTGLKITVIAVPTAMVEEKAKVMVASKDNMPDIFGSMEREQLNDIGVQGALESILPHADELPNFNKMFVEQPAEYKTEKVLKSWKAKDGNLYLFPGFGGVRDVNHGLLYRKDIFDKHNIPMWDGPDSYYEALKKLKSIYPNSTPMVQKKETSYFNRLAYSWGIQEWPGVYYDFDEKVWKYSSMDSTFREFLDYTKKLYDEKLLDQEFLTTTQAAWTSKMTQPEQAFTTFDWIDRMDMFYDQAKSTCPEYDLRYGNPVGPTQKVVTIPAVNKGLVVKKSEKSGLALKLLDYLISDGGAELMTCGIEGVTFNWNEDKTHAIPIGFEDGQTVGIKELEEKYGMCLPSFALRYDKACIYYNYTKKNQEAQDLINNKPGGGYLPEMPSLSFNDEEKDIIGQYDSKCRKIGEEFASNYILSAESGDAAWNDFLSRMKAAGAEEVVKVYNAAQARYDQE